MAQKLRKFKQIPIFIVENHNEVLEFIYRCIGARYLPFQNNKLLHFDAHPDMTIPRSMPASYAFDKEKLFNELSIENWIMPACYAGHINELIWAKPEWAEQIPNGREEFIIGDHCDFIRCNSKLEYFLSEASFRPEYDLNNKKLIGLNTITIPSRPVVAEVPLMAVVPVVPVEPVEPVAEETEIEKTDGSPVSALPSSSTTTFEQLENTFFSKIEISSNQSTYILDIDLDFFSTNNPFLIMFEKANVYNLLRPIFQYEIHGNENVDDLTVLNSIQNRLNQLDELEKVFNYLQLNKCTNLNNYKIPKILENSWDLLIKLIEIILKNYAKNEIDWTLVYNAGCTCCDNSDLPHHKSSKNEIIESIDAFKQFLINLNIPPTIITISRSSEDDYCPKDQVDWIEECVLLALNDVYKEQLTKKPIYQYKSEEWHL